MPRNLIVLLNVEPLPISHNLICVKLIFGVIVKCKSEFVTKLNTMIKRVNIVKETN